MCGPAAMLIVSIVGAAVSAYGIYQQGKIANEMAEHEAKQIEADAKAEQGYALVEAARIRRAKIFALGEANASLAASGIDVASPGALNINRDISKRAEEDAQLTILGGGDRAARMRAQAGVTRAGGKQAMFGATVGAASALAQGASSAYSKWKLGQGSTAGG